MKKGVKKLSKKNICLLTYLVLTLSSATSITTTPEKKFFFDPPQKNFNFGKLSYNDLANEKMVLITNGDTQSNQQVSFGKEMNSGEFNMDLNDTKYQDAQNPANNLNFKKEKIKKVGVVLNN